MAQRPQLTETRGQPKRPLGSTAGLSPSMGGCACESDSHDKQRAAWAKGWSRLYFPGPCEQVDPSPRASGAFKCTCSCGGLGGLFAGLSWDWDKPLHHRPLGAWAGTGSCPSTTQSNMLSRTVGTHCIVTHYLVRQSFTKGGPGPSPPKSTLGHLDSTGMFKALCSREQSEPTAQ